MALSLTDLQLSVMRVLWARGEATVYDVQEGLRPERDLANATVATLLTRLEKRGIVSRRAEGRHHLYHARVDEAMVRRSMVAELRDMLFGGSSAALISHLIDGREIDEGDLEQVKRMLEEHDATVVGAAGHSSAHGERAGGTRE
jgi:BlaI family penicillinase repressor